MNNIKRIREEQLISQTQLAKKAGLSRPYLSNIEGNIASPTIEKAAAIAAALGKTVDEVFCK